MSKKSGNEKKNEKKKKEKKKFVRIYSKGKSRNNLFYFYHYF